METISPKNTDSKISPHYQRIYDDLAGRIASGDLPFGAQLPLPAEMCVQYGVSEAPVRRALDELARAGLVVRQRGRGKGTYVQKRTTPDLVLRILMLGFDLSRSTMEASHDVYEILAGIRDAAAAHNILVQTVAESALGSLAPPAPESETVYAVIAHDVAGYERAIGIAAQTNAPCVLINTPPVNLSATKIAVDMQQGSFLGTDHLARLGHRRIAYVGATDGSWSKPRLQGYHRALEAHGIGIDPALICHTAGIDANDDVAALDALLALPEPPTAIFAGSDYRALHLMAHAQNRLGLRIPQDLSLCGYDSIGACETVLPTLTSVYHPLREQGNAIIHALLELKQTGKTEDVLLKPRLIARDSSAPYNDQKG